MDFNKNQIENLIELSKVEKALDKLSEVCEGSSFKNEVIMLKHRFTNNKKKNIRGIVSEELYQLEMNKISNSILEFVDMLDEAFQEEFLSADSYRIVYAASRPLARWDYYNYPRIFELFLNLDIDYKDIKTYEDLLIMNIVNKLGTINEEEEWRIQGTPKYYSLDFYNGILVNYYMKCLLERIIKKTPIIDISNFEDNLEKLKESLAENRFITCQLGFYFNDVEGFKSRYWNLRRGYYKNKVMEIEFTFDPWYCTSSSATFTSLRRKSIITPILFVRSIEEKEGKLKLDVSCLAIGYYFHNLQVKRFKRYNRI